MFLIRKMSFSAFLLPQLLGYFRKKGVRFGGGPFFFFRERLGGKKRGGVDGVIEIIKDYIAASNNS